mgnify:CR=1 FL=1|tara:strand:- start:341 stop:754 length:414 start_codon:yes stop_codon:yes gene_type:complete
MRDMKADLKDINSNTKEFNIEEYGNIIEQYPYDEAEYKSEHGEDVYDQELVDHVDWQEIEANHSSLSHKDSKENQELVYALGDPDEEFGKKLKPTYDYINSQRLLDLTTLGFSDVSIAETLHVSLDSVTRAKARHNL